MRMMTVYQRDFDAEIEAEQRAAAHARACVYTQEDLDRATLAAATEAEAEGRKLGHAEGRTEAEAEIAARHAAALEAMAPQLSRLIGAELEHRAALEAQMLSFVLAVCEKVFPEFIASRSTIAASDQVRRSLGLALHSPRLSLRLAAAAAARIGPDLETLAQTGGVPRQIDLVVDPALDEGDAQLAWQNGFMHYSYGAICKGILTLLRDLVPAPRPALATTADPESPDDHALVRIAQTVRKAK